MTQRWISGADQVPRGAPSFLEKQMEREIGYEPFRRGRNSMFFHFSY